MSTPLRRRLTAVHLGCKAQRAQALLYRLQLWVDVDKHQRLASPSQAGLHHMMKCSKLISREGAGGHVAEPWQSHAFVEHV